MGKRTCLARNWGYAQGRLNFNAVGDSGFLNFLPVIIEKPEGRKILLRGAGCGVISGLGNSQNMIPSSFLTVRPLTSVSDPVNFRHFVQKFGSESFHLNEREISPFSLSFLIKIQCCGSGAFLTPEPWIRDGQKIRIRIRDEQPGHISESLETIFWVKLPTSTL